MTQYKVGLEQLSLNVRQQMIDWWRNEVMDQYFERDFESYPAKLNADFELKPTLLFWFFSTWLEILMLIVH